MKKRDFLKALLTGGAGAVVVAATGVKTAGAASPAPVAPTVSTEGVTWPCVGCKAETTTPKAIWDATKLRMSCGACGRRQPYLWHLKKFDPTPTEYVGGPGHALATIHDARPSETMVTPVFRPHAFVTSFQEAAHQPSKEELAYRAMTPRQRSEQYWRKRREKKRRNKKA